MKAVPRKSQSNWALKVAFKDSRQKKKSGGRSILLKANIGILHSLIKVNYEGMLFGCRLYTLASMWEGPQPGIGSAKWIKLLGKHSAPNGIISVKQLLHKRTSFIIKNFLFKWYLTFFKGFTFFDILNLISIIFI